MIKNIKTWKWEELEPVKQNLILFQATRAIWKAIEREEVAAMCAMLALEARITPEVYGEVVKQTGLDPVQIYLNATNVYGRILNNIKARCGLDIEETVNKILADERVDMECSDLLLQLVTRVAK